MTLCLGDTSDVTWTQQNRSADSYVVSWGIPKGYSLQVSQNGGVDYKTASSDTTGTYSNKLKLKYNKIGSAEAVYDLEIGTCSSTLPGLVCDSTQSPLRIGLPAN